jgi:hypothetical protein
MSNNNYSGKAFNTPRERSGARGFASNKEFSRPGVQKVGKAYKRGQEYAGPYASSDLGKDPIDRSNIGTGLSGNTDGEGE